jgi:hypothetical protein
MFMTIVSVVSCNLPPKKQEDFAEGFKQVP